MSAGRDTFVARTVRARAPGKINVSLRVGPLREDGYHSVASVYLAVSLYEEVAATSTEEPGITVSLDSRSSLDLTGADIPLDHRNLAYRAAELMAEVSEKSTGVHLDIVKRVPVAGGMGGGSADAAATLLACDALWDSGLSREELTHLAQELGADVPFALLGGTAVGLGVGDQLTPALARTRLNWVLVPAGYGLSTPQVYNALDWLREESGIEADEPTEVDPQILKAMRAGDAGVLGDVLANDLQPAALHLAPQLAETLQLVEHHGALAAMVSGSGPTIAVLAADDEGAMDLVDLLNAEGVGALAVHGPVHGAKIISDTLL